MPSALTLVSALDVSSGQPTDLTHILRAYLPDGGHVIVKHYNNFEAHHWQDYTLAQLDSAVANGYSIGAYTWCFDGYSPEETVKDCIALAKRGGRKLSLLAADCETYNDGTYRDDGPTPAWLHRFEAACRNNEIEPWVYTGLWWWGDGTPNNPGYTMHGTDEFSHLGLWDSRYTGVRALTQAYYGGWKGNTVASQWWDKPYDQSVVRSDFARY